DLEDFRRIVVVGDEVYQLAIEPIHGAHAGAAETYRVGHDGVEDRLDIGRRARDDPEDLAGRRLLFQRLGEIAVPGLQLLEEADVLDGDDGLVGKGLEELDLLVRERPDLHAADQDGSEGLAFAQERRGEGGPVAVGPLRLPAVRELRFRFRRAIADVDRWAVADGTAGYPAATDEAPRVNRDRAERGGRLQGVPL